jgi:uncharacterized protein YndB with AHSA1/START domain
MAAAGVEGRAVMHIEAPPEKVYALVSDVTRMGEWSPETYGAAWIDGATGPAPGSRFRGRNKQSWMKWSTKCTVTAAEPGKEFTFVVGNPDKPQTRWSYRMGPSNGGTDLTESFESLRYNTFFKVIMPPKRRTAKLQRDVEETVRRVKSVAEGSA